MLNWKVALKNTLDPVINPLTGNKGLRYRNPQELATPPIVTYFVVTDVSGVETGPQDVLFQIDIFHESDITAEAIRDAIRGALHDQPFAVVGATHHYLRELNKVEDPYDQDVEAFHFIMEFRSLYHID